MSEAQALRLTYCAIVTIAFILAGIGRNFRERQKHYLVYVVILILAILIGFRPIDAFTDLPMYENWFNQICRKGWLVVNNKFNEFGQDPVFSILFFITSPLKSFNFTLTLISFLTLYLTYKVSQLYTSRENNGSPLLLFFCLIINFTYLNQQDNVMRIGLAFPLLLFYLYYFYSREYKKAIIFGVLATGIHFSMAVAICISVMAKYINCSLKWYYVLFFLILLASAAGASIQQFVGYFGFSKAEIYSQLKSSGNYKVGFRPDFALFNTLFLLFFIWTNKKKPSEFLTYYIRLYVLFSCWFFLWFKVPYNDRVGAFSWNLIPIISYFECIGKFHRKKVVWGSYLFGALLMMTLIIFIHITRLLT